MNRITQGLLAALFAVSVSAHAELFSFDSGPQGFTVSTPSVAANPWVWSAPTGSWFTAFADSEIGTPNTTNLTSPEIEATDESVAIAFNHRYSFEDDGTSWDGGAFYLSVNGGAFIYVAGANFSANGYNGTVAASSNSILKGLPAFVGTSANFTTPAFLTSVADISDLVALGDTFQFRFVAGGDTNTNGSFLPTWEIDSIEVRNGSIGSSVPEPATLALFGIGLAGLGFARRKLN